MDNATRENIVRELKRAYAGELETVQNYLANSVDLDGVRAEEIKKSLAADIQEELGHAMMLAKRIKVLGGRVPGSMELEREQTYMQPPKDSTDLITVIKGVIAAEDSAIAGYEKIIELCDKVDPGHAGSRGHLARRRTGTSPRLCRLPDGVRAEERLTNVSRQKPCIRRAASRLLACCLRRWEFDGQNSSGQHYGMSESASQFTIRLATIADAAIIAGHRARMWQDMGDVPPELLEPLHSASEVFLKNALENGEYIGWLAALSETPEKIVAGAGVNLRRVMAHPVKRDGQTIRIADGREGQNRECFH